MGRIVPAFWLAALAALPLALSASAAEVSFKDKAISMLITASPGGGTDTQARLVGRYLQKYLPGNPAIVYVNMPGAAGIIGANHLVHQTKPDGLTLLAASGETVEPTTLHNPSVRYDPHQFALLGGTNSGGTVMVIRDNARARLTDEAVAPVVVGSVTTRTGISMGLWGAEFLGWHLKWVYGYPSTPALMSAIERGEIDMTGTEAASQLAPLLESGGFTGLVQSGRLADGKFVARASFPDIPVFAPLVVPKLDGLAREAFNFWLYSNDVSKWFALAPGTEPDIVATYRAAYRAIGGDAEFIPQSKKAFGEDFALVGPDDLKLAITKLADTSDAALEFNRQLRVKNGLPPD
jgi:tripartite-type tricarboxylate transporter receptor subunit TctC